MTKFALMMLLLAAIQVNAATLNVPSQYGTINGALEQAQPGDTILLAAGTYDYTVTTVRSGTSGNPIVIDGQNAADVLVRAIDIRHAYTTWKRMTVKNTVQSSTGKVVYLNRNSHYTRLENIVVDGGYTPNMTGIEFAFGATRPFATDAPSNCVITGCTVKQIMSAQMILITGDNNLIENNTLQDGDRIDFFRIWGRDNIIRGNVCDNIFLGPNSGGYHPDCYQTFGSNGIGSTGHIIENNIFKNAQAQIAQLTDDLAGNIGNWTVRNNLFMNITNAHSCSIPNMKYYNNVFYRCNYGLGGHALGFGSRSYTVEQSYTGVAGRSSAHGAQAFNNIFLDCGSTRTNTGWYTFGEELIGVAADYNAVFKFGGGVRNNTSMQTIGGATGWENGLWYEPNGKNGVDPRFVNIGGADARLSTTSPMLDAGTTLADVTTDAFGNARPAGGAYDIGLYEGAGVVPVGNAPVITITNPANLSSFEEGIPQTFNCTVTDVEDGNITTNITWGDAIEGLKGTGASLSFALSNSRKLTLNPNTPEETVVPHPDPQQHAVYAFVKDSDNRVSYATIYVDVERTSGTNAPPTVSITAPANGISVEYVDWVSFSATASDDIDGDISAEIVWSSSINGSLAVGAAFERNEFPVGTHTITATVTDSGGLSASASIVLNVSQGNVFFGERVPLEWDANPAGDNVIRYRVYRRTGSDPYVYTFIDSTTGTSADVRVPSGEHAFVVTAVNAAGESLFSNAFEILVVNSNKKNFRGPGKPKSILIP